MDPSSRRAAALSSMRTFWTWDGFAPPGSGSMTTDRLPLLSLGSVILTKDGEAQGALDGSPYRGQRSLNIGAHSFVTGGEKQQLACLWAPAFIRGFSPFHLKDREFNGSPVFRPAHDHPGAAPRRRRHRGWGFDSASPGVAR